MVQIRNGIFETNSSSSHSLVIRSADLLRELEEDEYFTHDEMLESLSLTKKTKQFGHKYSDWYFGRYPFRDLYDFDDRVAYAYANFVYSDEKLKELESLLCELVPECKGIIKPDNVGVDEPFLATWMDKYNISLREYLTNKKYVTIQDGDEYYNWSDLIKAGIIDCDVIENYKDWDIDL